MNPRGRTNDLLNSVMVGPRRDGFTYGSLTRAADNRPRFTLRVTMWLFLVFLLSVPDTNATAQVDPDGRNQPQYFYVSFDLNRLGEDANRFFSTVVFYPGREECGASLLGFSEKVHRGLVDGVWQRDQIPRDFPNIRASETKVNDITVSFGDGGPRYRGDRIPVFPDKASAEAAKSQAISRYQSNPPTSRGTRYVVTEADFDTGVTCGSARPPEEAETPRPQETPSDQENVRGIALAAPPVEWRKSTPEELARARELARRQAAVTDVMARTGAKDTPRNRKRAEELAALRDRIQPKKDESCRLQSPQFHTTGWLWFYKMQPDGEPVIRASMEARGAKECSRMTGGDPGRSVTNFQCVADGANADIYKLCSATIQCAGQARQCEAGATAQ